MWVRAGQSPGPTPQVARGSLVGWVVGVGFCNLADRPSGSLLVRGTLCQTSALTAQATPAPRVAEEEPRARSSVRATHCMELELGARTEEPPQKEASSQRVGSGTPRRSAELWCMAWRTGAWAKQRPSSVGISGTRGSQLTWGAGSGQCWEEGGCSPDRHLAAPPGSPHTACPQ